MSITGAIILFAVTWFMVFFCVLPLRMVTQGDLGEVVPGTPKAAPAGFVVARKAKVTTMVALVLWIAEVGIVQSGWITIRDLDFFGRMSPESTAP